jgi:hypothetical protein
MRTRKTAAEPPHLDIAVLHLRLLVVVVLLL